MPENNEKVEDFIKLWRKKMQSEINKPSAIGETLERIKEVEKENEELRIKIKENIELISKTEEIIKKTIDENERLKEELKQKGMVDEPKISDFQQENLMLNNRLISLEKNLVEKEVELRARNNEITELKIKLDTNAKTIDSSTSEKDTGTTKELIENLRSELSKKKSQIEELEIKINELTEENENLNQQLVEKIKKLEIDYVVPVDPSKPSLIRPQSPQTSTETLEILCQDLQSDLNKYKRLVEKLNKEKSELEQTVESGGFKLEPNEIQELKRENEELKNELSQVQISLQQKSQETNLSPQISELKKKINILEENIKEKDHLITELQTTQESPTIIHEGPMSGLIEDLQSKINKLKITIEEKNKIIEELKSS
ncbi:MAG: hypothetical protein ACFE75_04330 [Candidatus Hodarchaeota archaeon]